MTTNSPSKLPPQSGRASRGVAGNLQVARRGAGLLLTLTSLGMTACATTTRPYNPDHLGDAQVSRIAGICQTTLGLSPKESPVLGVYLGSPHLDAQVSHYQACIASLSDSVRHVADAAAADQADQDCRARGLGPAAPPWLNAFSIGFTMMVDLPPLPQHRWRQSPRPMVSGTPSAVFSMPLPARVVIARNWRVRSWGSSLPTDISPTA